MYYVNTKLIEKYMKEHNMGTREFASLCRVPMAAITRLLHTKTSYNLVFLYRVSCGMDIDLRKLLDD
ncbi:MAG: hypothetical protein IKA12_01930 [Clostridia bacterium]|nr:hypothetical protein [Clostridia bacterium]